MSVGIIPQYEMSFIVNVIENKKYITAINAIKPHPSAGILKRAIITPAVSTQPMSCHGLYLPHFVRVFSTMPPMIGSLNASKILAATMMNVIAVNCATLRCFVSTQNESKYPLKKLYRKSLPNVPSGNIKKLRFESFVSSDGKAVTSVFISSIIFPFVFV